MIVGEISNTSPTSAQTLLAKPRKDLQGLQSDLNSGDLPGAQRDFADFQKDISSLLNAPPSTPGGLQKAAADFKALQSDLDSGDLKASQKDFSSLLADLQASGVRKHHKHHHPESSETEAAASGTAPTSLASAGTSANGFDFRTVMAAYAAFNRTGSSGTNLNATA